eukprot:m51a1_g12175 hypothetical protein (658) ;mRNA; f:1048-3783
MQAEKGVGKTSLVVALSANKFDESAPPVVEHAMPVYSSTEAHEVLAHAIDTSCAPGKRSHLERLLHEADVVCVVYDVTRPETLARVGDYWLPEIRRVRPSGSVPVVVAANKADVGGEAGLEPVFSRIIEDNHEVESCIACSARQLLYLPKLVEAARRAVTHPLGPLYDLSTARLTGPCVRALTRVFKLLDRNKDGSLDDAELNAFQRLSYEDAAELTAEELQGIKRKVVRAQPDGVDDNGLTLSGFLYLHHKLCERNKAEATWRLLYAFGYDKTLELSELFLQPPMVVGSHERLELSEEGLHFLEDLFRRHDKDGDGALNDAELRELFSVTPGHPWREGFPAETGNTNADGNLTMAGFMSQWAMTTLVNYRITMHYLAFFGFPRDTRNGFRRVRNSPEYSKLPQRSTWLCYVFGSRGCGKAILRGLLGKPFSREYFPTTSYNAVCNCPDPRMPQVHLAMMEFANEDDVVYDAEGMKRCDVCCLLHDASDPSSFSHVMRLHQHLMRHYPKIPCLHFVTKSDLPVAPQNSSKTPSQFLLENRLQPAIRISLHDGVMEGMYAMLATAAANPLPYRCRASVWGMVRRPKTSEVLKTGWSRALIIAFTALGVVLAAFGVRPLFRFLARRLRQSHPAFRCWWWILSLRSRLFSSGAPRGADVE